MLLTKANEAEGLLWRLLRNSDNGEGMEWILQVLPRLGWLLVAGEAWYCNTLTREPALQIQTPLASWIKVCSRLILQCVVHP